MVRKTLGHYKIIRQVGSGGMGEVYAAEDPKLGRQVALKLLPEAMASEPERVQRFRREAKAIAALDHPNIVTIYSVENAEDLNFITMQLVEGGTLSQQIPRRGMPLGRLFDLAIQMADAISTAHEHGITHRDLKPDNIMVTDERRVKILDFGLAKLREEAGGKASTMASDPSLTSEGRLIGTMAYMSPEQAEGKPVDHRSDIFSLGIILYEMATGEHPFKGDTSISVISSIVKDTPKPVTELRPGLPRHLDRIIRLCLQKDREHRFQSVKDLRNELVILKREVEASPDHALALRGPRRTTAGPLVKGGLLGAVSGLVVATALMYGLPSGDDLQIDLGHVRRITGAPELEIHPAISPGAKMIAYVQGPAGMLRLHLRPVAGGKPIPIAEELEGNHLWPQWSPKGDRIAFESGGQRWLVFPTGGDLRELEGASGEGGMAWSPDKTRIAYIQNNRLFVRRIEGGDPVELVKALSPNSPAWSPDSSRIAFVSGNFEYSFGRFTPGNIAPASVWVVSAAGGDSIPVIDDGTLNVNPVWLDSLHLLFLSDKQGTRDVYVVFVDRDGGTAGSPRRLTTGLDAHSFSLSQDGSQIAYSEFTSRANVWSIRIPSEEEPISNREARQVTRGNQVVEGIGVSRNGKTLAFDSNRSGNQDIYKMALPSGTPQQVTEDPDDDFLPDFSPDGREMAFYSFRTGNRELFVMTPDGKGIRQVTNDPAQDRYPHWSPDGNQLVYYSDKTGRQELWVVSRPDRSSEWGTPRRLTSDGGMYGRWSPDGDTIAFARPDGIWVIPAAGGEPRHLVVPSLELTRIPFPNWSADGRAIYMKATDQMGRAGFWSVPVDGRQATRLVVFDDRSRPSTRGEFANDGRHFYFTISELHSDVFTLELRRPAR